MNLYSLDREVDFQGKRYKVVAVLESEMLLVVEKEIFETKSFPMQTLVIPGE